MAGSVNLYLEAVYKFTYVITYLFAYLLTTYARGLLYSALEEFL